MDNNWLSHTVVPELHGICRYFISVLKKVFYSKMKESAKLFFLFTTFLAETDVDQLVFVI